MKKNDLTGMDSLVSGILSRHGIKRQVTSAMIVSSAQRIIISLVPEVAVNDVKVISFTENDLRVACRHSAASHTVSKYGEKLINQLKEKFPDIQLERVTHRIDPYAWNEIKDAGFTN